MLLSGARKRRAGSSAVPDSTMAEFGESVALAERWLWAMESIETTTTEVGNR